MILDEFIRVSVNKSNARHYENLGYHIEKKKDERGRDRIKCGQIIEVKVSDLPTSSNVLVNVECDYCHAVFQREYGQVNKSREVTKKDACFDCRTTKLLETKMTVYNTTNTSIIAKMNNSTDGRPNKYTWDEVINKCKERGYIFCKNNDTNVKCTVKSKINYICSKHVSRGEQKTTVGNMMDDKREFLCNVCRGEEMSMIRSKSTIEEAIQICKDKGYTILTDSIKNCDDEIIYICNKHKDYGEQKTTLYGLQHYKNNCRMCKMPKGEEHWHWNGGISSEREKFKSTVEYKTWRKKVFERDNYTCQCCGRKGVYLEAHHKYSYSDYPDLRLDIDNGISLCTDCHSINVPGSFHSVYTQYHNTPEQLEEYIANYKKQHNIEE